MRVKLWSTGTFLAIFLTAAAAQNELSNICTCDLTAFACDVNCCCDNECAVSDQAVFSHCEDIVHALDPQYCVHPNLLFFNSSSYKTTINSFGLLCILRDNCKFLFYLYFSRALHEPSSRR
uniref:Tectonic domain-containing protein n=1 Tax=Plectus sambesii TaxID=2011161 RepID=A0A914XBR3_9BILA